MSGVGERLVKGGVTFQPSVLRYRGKRLKVFPVHLVLRDTQLQIIPVIVVGERRREAFASYQAPDRFAGFELRLHAQDIPSRLARQFARQEPGLLELWTQHWVVDEQDEEYPWIYWAFPQVTWMPTLDGYLLGEVGYSDAEILDGQPIGHGGWLYTTKPPPGRR